MLVDKVANQQFLVTMWPEEYTMLQNASLVHHLSELQTMELILCVTIEKLSKEPRALLADAGDDGLPDVDGDRDSIDGDAEEKSAS